MVENVDGIRIYQGYWNIPDKFSKMHYLHITITETSSPYSLLFLFNNPSVHSEGQLRVTTANLEDLLLPSISNVNKSSHVEDISLREWVLRGINPKRSHCK